MINPDDNTKADTLALSSDGKIIENISYPLQGTPCEHVANAETIIHPNNIQQLFPNDHLLVEMEAVSYAGVP